MGSRGKPDTGRGERIRKVRTEILRLNSQERFAEVLSAETGESLTRGAVGNWELGKEVGLKNLKAIAELANVSLDWLAYNHGPPPRPVVDVDDFEDREVPVVGYVGAGAAAHFYNVGQGELDRVRAPKDWTPDTVAVEVRGESLGPLFNQWLVYYDEVRSPVTPDMIGRLCVVALPDDRILVKQIKRSKTAGLFDLLSNTEDPIRGVEITWAAKVKTMEPK